MLSLTLTNFRSHKDSEFDFAGKDLLIGKNGTGKTTLLEAIYYLNYTKSYRSNFDQDLVGWGQDFFRIEGRFEENNIKAVYLKKNRTKQLELNNSKQKAIEFIGSIPLVLFAPELIEIIIGSPKKRRQYIDMVISGIDRTHIMNLNLYRHLLRQRNGALATATKYQDLIHWDSQMIKVGQEIVKKRSAFVLFAGGIINHYYAEAVRQFKGSKVKMIYRDSIKTEDDWVESLSKNFEKDKLLGLTLAGPHRDDVLFFINGRRIATSASRGEQRTFLLALKRTEIDFLQTKLKERRPLLLLDDVFSELDLERSNLLFNLMKNYPSITTCTDAAQVSESIKKEFNIIRM